MLHYYCFMPAKGKITAATKVFKVAVGSGPKDQVSKLCVESFAKRKGFYFRLWDKRTELEIGSRLIQSAVDPNSVCLGYQCIHVPVRALWVAACDGTIHLLKDAPKVSRNLSKMMAILSPSFFFSHAFHSLASTLPPPPRKNLSVRPSSDDICAAISFGALVLLYWLGCLVRQWELSVL